MDRCDNVVDRIMQQNRYTVGRPDCDQYPRLIRDHGIPLAGKGRSGFNRSVHQQGIRSMHLLH
jgi:hypothetical protein